MTVYFVQSVHGGPIKIGRAEDVFARLRELQTGSPVRLLLVATTHGNALEETALHQAFVMHHLHGEWFAPAPQLLAHIRSLGGKPLGDFEFAPRELERETPTSTAVKEIPAGPRGHSQRIARYPWVPSVPFQTENGEPMPSAKPYDRSRHRCRLCKQPGHDALSCPRTVAEWERFRRNAERDAHHAEPAVAVLEEK
jgi:hypothetical protein